ncbi:MAG TPA: tetratricopeptide repeat protein [Ensifer sp.]|jgi:Flp pilus assembly protein TadD|uniref:tetratricopeptide repeat protein n=1 Tax=Ensifer sp. TaxID=1872086 RepID=UPI002E12B935|nr:tetratricopeptide repeat protein [Ensifer sp.]
MNTTADSLHPLVQQAMAASQSGDSVRALELLHQASSAQPDSGIPHFLMGSEYASLSQFEQAELAFSNAVLLSPNMPVARYQLGLLQYSSGRAPAALVTWQPLLALGDASPLPHWVKGFAALAQDQFDTAKACFEEGVRLNTDNPPMSSDINKIIAEIEAVQRANAENTGAVAQASSDEGDNSSHFLVSNYGRQGPIH